MFRQLLRTQQRGTSYCRNPTTSEGRWWIAVLQETAHLVLSLAHICLFLLLILTYRDVCVTYSRSRLACLTRVPTSFPKSNSRTFQAFSTSSSSFSSALQLWQMTYFYTVHTVYTVYQLFHFFITSNRMLSSYKPPKKYVFRNACYSFMSVSRLAVFTLCVECFFNLLSELFSDIL